METETFEFRFTHVKRSDGQVVGVLPVAEVGMTAYALQAGGQTFVKPTVEFQQRYRKL